MFKSELFKGIFTDKEINKIRNVFRDKNVELLIREVPIGKNRITDLRGLSREEQIRIIMNGLKKITTKNNH